jgi:IS4 transposase
VLIAKARKLYCQDEFGRELDETVYALDSTTIDLCLALFPWAHFRRYKGAIKLHTLLDVRGSIPSFIHITDGKVHDVRILDVLVAEPGSFYIMDRGYLDFARLYVLAQGLAFFVIRSKQNLQFHRVYSHPIDNSTGLRCDQTILLTGPLTSQLYPEKLRRVRVFDAPQQKGLTFLTNNFTLPALTITQLYKSRWHVELFFKWIKQHLRIKAFYGTTENAVKTQVWIAVSVYVLVAIWKKQLKLDLSLYTMLQIFSLTLFEKDPLLQVLTKFEPTPPEPAPSNQLQLFDL